MLAGIRRELLGPAGCGFALKVPFEGDPVDSYQPYVDEATGDEILTIERPLDRYGIGVLFPRTQAGGGFRHDDDQATEVADASSVHVNETGAPTPLSSEGAKALARVERRVARARGAAIDETPADLEGDDNASELEDTTHRRPASMAISFRVRATPSAQLHARLPITEPGTPHPVNGRYERFTVRGRNPRSGDVRDYDWWVRRQVDGEAVFSLPASVEAGARLRLRPVRERFDGAENIRLEFRAYVRRFPGGEPHDLVVTVALTNRTELCGGIADGSSLFQAYFEVSPVVDTDCTLHPLPGGRVIDDAAKSLDFIYRHAAVYAVGHGCSADWRTDAERTTLIATPFPRYETPSMTPELTREDGSPLVVSMADLAGLSNVSDELVGLDVIVREYEAWIDKKAAEAEGLHGRERGVAKVHLARATSMLERMRRGAALLRSDDTARRAFRLMNHAMLLQQIQSKQGRRAYVPETRQKPARFEPAITEPDAMRPPEGRGSWRPFQIGFILATLPSTFAIADEDRDLVDLIWFPTGGGKTEAYLGLTAFSAIVRRLRDPRDAGTDTLMRYTLRLLTAQQFERASALICALEMLRRRQNSGLGDVPFSIGLWVGGGTTPNSWQDAKDALSALGKNRDAQNPFIVSSCPWCAAEMGPKRKSVVLGYKRSGSIVKLHCPDPRCPFHESLPLQVVDEGLYAEPPTVLIATVDKLALVAWNEKVRSFFGINADGQRSSSPPNLIIQDELHLITGPLGSMVGAYEPLLEHLCRVDALGVPKVVCSTATVRNYEDQARWLFGRERTTVFPPPALCVDDSFFGVRATLPDGQGEAGRLYVGVYGSALGSTMTAQIRVYAAALQSVMTLPDAHRDAYWTLLGFFNTLRDLGSTTTLLRDQIQGQMLAMWRRAGLLSDDAKALQRTLVAVEELTSRLRSEEVPQALSRLAVPYGDRDTATDVCLASSMIEVGIDVERLGLMVVTGQPKTNAQYIQVTGRVGRDWRNRPGLVLAVYAPNRARDRSVFETFRANHERMYANVEPASVTPFSLPAMKRALHATMVAFVRQLSPREALESPSRVDLSVLDQFKDLMLRRVRVVDESAIEDMAKLFDAHVEHWRTVSPTKWANWNDPSDENVLLTPPSGAAAIAKTDLRWPTPQSMRSVDAECGVDTFVVQKVWARGRSEHEDG